MRNLSRLFVAATLLLTTLPASAQYPNKPIRIIVPFPPGGAADAVARIVAQPLSAALGQSVTVDNRPGADGAIAAEAVIKSSADGYTLFLGTNTAMSAVPLLRKVPPYDPVADFSHISLVGKYNFFLFVHASVPAKSFPELLDYARANPGKLNYGTGNPLSILSNVQLMNAAGIDMVHVPYKGEGPLTPDLLAGRVESAILSNPAGIQLAKDGRLRALAVLADQRSPLLPDVPTFAEAGLPQITVRQWAGVYGPPKMPREIVERLNKEVTAAVRRPDIVEKLQSYGYAAEASTPERLLEINREDLALWRKLVREASLPLE